MDGERRVKLLKLCSLSPKTSRSSLRNGNINAAQRGLSHKMPFSNYTDLQSAVANWLHRADLESEIPDFIHLAESDFNRRLNVTAKEVGTSLTLAAGSLSVPLPADYATPVALWNEFTQPRWQLPAMTVAEMPRTTVHAMPRSFAIDGRTIVFDATADQSYPLTLRYIQSLHLADSADGTSDMLTRYPDLFLYGALAQSAPFLRDDARLPMWSAMYEKLIAGVKGEAARDKGIASLRTDIPRSNQGRYGFNIDRGW